MKNLLLATTALVLTAGAAAAETGVKISGYGRTGLMYDSKPGAGFKKTTVHTRLRFNIDATTETDSGVTFGGRVRIQDQNNYSGAGLSSAMLYATYQGMRVEVGNANTAYDSSALIYDSELGLVDSSYGDPRSSFYSFNSGANPADYMGVFGSYTINGVQIMASYVNPDQTVSNLPAGVSSETSLSVNYSNDQFAVSAAAAQNGAGVDGNDMWFIGGAYKGLANTTIGLNYIDEGIDGAGVSLGKTAVLYANYKMGATTLKGYVAHNDYINNDTDTAIGIGADYDLGGAKLTGGIQKGYGTIGSGAPTVADLGVRFDF